MRKIVTVLGARPQFIKASVVSGAIEDCGQLKEVVVHTGQHFDTNMSDVFFDQLGMAAPAYQLDIHGGSHGIMTGRMLAEVEGVLLAERPDAVLVYGDTNSTLAGALAAVKLQIPVAHVEAGLRSFNLAMPEEINRILTDRISQWLFTPTDLATAHLRNEGVDIGRIVPVGDVMYDVALHHGARTQSSGGVLERAGVEAGSYVLVTVHRAENTDHPQRLTCIVDALHAISEHLPVVWPIHPRTRAVLEGSDRLGSFGRGIRLLDPLGYLDMVQLEKYASVIATDSGGVQKEAFFFRVPCVTLRDETEWVELVDAGWNRLVSPTSCEAICEAVLGARGVSGIEAQPYGDGRASKRIVERLCVDVCAST